MVRLYTTDGRSVEVPYERDRLPEFVASLDEATRANYKEALRKEEEETLQRKQEEAEQPSGFHPKI